MKKTGLGKGLEALIPSTIKLEKEEITTYVPINKIDDNPYQIRSQYDEEKLRELTQSIEEKGILQPIVVRKKNDRYELIAGSRRLIAAKEANLDEIPVIIRVCDDSELLQLTLIENLLREDLNPLDEAIAYKRLIDEFNLTQEQVAKLIGKSRPEIANTLRLLNLPEYIKESIRNNKISKAHARTISSVKDENLQKELFDQIIKEHLSVRELEKKVSKISKSKKGDRKAKDIYIQELEDKLQQALSTKVSIHRGKKKGTLLIEFYSDEDLMRIIERLTQ